MRNPLNGGLLGGLALWILAGASWAADADEPIHLHCKPAPELCVLHETLQTRGREPTHREASCAEASLGQNLILADEADVLIDASFQRTPLEFVRVKIGRSNDGSVKSAWTLRISRTDGSYRGNYSSVLLQGDVTDQVQAQTQGVCSQLRKTGIAR